MVFKKNHIASLIIISASFFAFLLVVNAETSGSPNSSIAFKKDSNKLFVITIKDPQGIRSFSLKAPDKAPYGGDLGGCPTLRILDNVLFYDPADFTPVMKVQITDCSGNVDEMEASPPKDGEIKGVRVGGLVAEPSVKSSSTQGKSTGVSAKQDASVSGVKKQEAGKPEIKYPVAELNNCQNENECRAYCDDSANIKACVDFAEANGLMSNEEAERARRFSETSPLERPGGCGNEIECVTFCEDSSHIDECIAFADKHGFMPEEELAQAKKIMPLIKSGQTPGGCKTKAQCEIYCSDAAHIEGCLTFAEENGLIEPEELAMAKKMMPLIKNGETPGGCVSKIQCEAYCSEPTNMRKCLEFGEKQGIIPPEELAMAKKMLPLMENGEMPGGCRSKESCEEYCNTEGNMKECIAFAEKAGFMTEEEAEMARKTGGKGPGGCQSREQCDGYCKQNQEECMRWAEENGLGGEFGGPGGGGFSGPGGCKSQEECMAYCKDHQEECKNFAPPGGATSGATGGDFPGGPGGCKSPEECILYCTSHYTDPVCASYITGGGSGGGPGGCRSEEECRAYCESHYTDLACGGTGGPTPTPPPPPSGESCVPPPSGLVSWWPAGAGTDIISGNNGEVVAPNFPPLQKAGKVGSASLFGANQVSVGNPANLNFGTGPFSLEAWVNWDSSGLSNIKNIIRKSNYPVTGSGAGYWLRIGAGNLEFSVGATTQAEGQSIIIAPISSGVWHHIVGTKDDSGNIKLYINGQPQGNLLRQASETNVTSEAPFTLGFWIDRFGATEFFSGLIDEVSVYNRALGASEVQAIFNAGSAGKCAGSSALPPPPPPTDYPTGGQYPTSGSGTTQDYCSYFTTVPSCSYVGSPDSQNYKYCKECFPDK